ncbi:3'-5' exonuclease [Marinobacterium rhizophilum]|uniref:3'-5' exonuclease n=1 Tax=Marinobacterium rhizophilum TaxID=420402 RepID=A0ABY5HR35_9GAMM|nr:3'-5' exonuclease [Marinobacterium rhizophilum]UTW13640.1 3'-5' exonuclease domain-containing protein 2 [Marinobacterium rhizophilum]
MKREEREAPGKADIALLPPFKGLELAQIRVPRSPEDFAAATRDLLQQRYIGFDTESKPTFDKGETSRGPHVVQLTTLKHAYIFQLWREHCCEQLCRILQSADTVKVGFGLRSDRSHIRRRLGITPNALLDLDQVFRRQGYRRELGVKAAIAVLLQQKFQKSKSVAMSNWALPELKENQLLYAGNDAYAARLVLDLLDIDDTALPISHAHDKARN